MGDDTWRRMIRGPYPRTEDGRLRITDDGARQSFAIGQCHIPCAVCCLLLFVVRCSLRVVRCSLCVVCCLPVCCIRQFSVLVVC